MPELVFKGKEFVYNHHLAVPFRPLEPDASKSVGGTALDGNLIIHGDNLHALKALLPMYAGKVDCVYIDPPYNTGNEGWCYNDNVNSPMMKEWLNSNPVGIEDGLRHDKWCAMMWPRLRLLRELLAEDGVIFVSIDDNEANHLRDVMDEVFGDDNFIACFVWQKVDSPNDNKVAITPDHEFIFCYAKDKSGRSFSPLDDFSILGAYTQRDESGRLFRDRLLKKNGRNSLRRDRPTMYFALTAPDGAEVYPIHDNGEEACWSAGRATIAKHAQAGTLIWKRRSRGGTEVWEPYTREFAPESPTRPFPTIWADLPTMRQAKAMLRKIFGTADVFDTPKPVELISRLLTLCGRTDGLVLDSFAGSGTTAHAVLHANRRDGGNRKFILVECEDYADKLTAERVRRVIKGYRFKGNNREDLFRKKLTWTELKRAEAIINEVAGIENLEGHRFDAILKKVEKGELVVTGEKKITQRTEGLGGSFTYCTLGKPLELDRLLTGETLPSFETLGAVLFHMASNEPFDASKLSVKDGLGYLGASSAYHMWLIYKPDLEFLKSAEAALTLKLAESLVKKKRDGKRHLVFAPARFVSQRMLNEAGLPVEFAPLPFALYRVERR